MKAITTGRHIWKVDRSDNLKSGLTGKVPTKTRNRSVISFVKLIYHQALVAFLAS